MTIPSHPTRPVDWTAIRRRMAAAIEQTEASLEASTKDAHGQGRETSSLLGADPFAGQGEAEKIGLVSFMLSQRQFALEVSYVCEIVSMIRLSPVPGMPLHVCGVYDLRGQLLPAFDLSALLDLAPRNGPANDWAIVCGQAQPEFLILSDAAPEILSLPLEDIRPAEPDPGDKAWHCATTEAGTFILDGRRLLEDRHLFLEDNQIMAGEAERKGTDASPVCE
ncbi:chemotaxis protein CheW (plasmid) [Sinorhizobium meliloti]|uniref:chemotaxis protein CheW n=1 Tax=Rhizobium meliloti TaxID=382 RepID=UPI002D787E5E|nr:chemotaxis protein CheW [Sinorhizobium meliloti]WRQ71155.1 chemotaxis protein CheW [Sinorhizobium meliloti]